MKNISIKTAQNVLITFELASLGQRVLAYMIDLMILLVYYLIIGGILNIFDWSTSDNIYEYTGSYYVISFILSFPAVFYSPITEYLTKGQSIGKLILGIRVMKTNGDNANLNDYLIRWLFKGLSFIIFPVEAIVILVSSRSQRIADIMANTVVVKLNPTFNYSLSQVLKKNKVPSEILYPEIAQFTDEDMMLIKRIIQRVETYNNQASKKLALDLVDELCIRLKLTEVPEKKMTFLKRVLKEYVVITR